MSLTTEEEETATTGQLRQELKKLRKENQNLHWHLYHAVAGWKAELDHSERLNWQINWLQRNLTIAQKAFNDQSTEVGAARSLQSGPVVAVPPVRRAPRRRHRKRAKVGKGAA